MRPRRLKVIFTLIFILLMLLRRTSLAQHGLLLFLSRETFQISQRYRRRLLMLLLRQQRLLQNHHQRRRPWVWPRPQNWFRVLLRDHSLDVLWKEHFRVTLPTFEYICNLVRPDLQKQQTRMRTPISVEERVGLALWRIATGNSFRTCGLQFGYGKSTAKCICEEFEKALARKKDQFIQFPVTREDIQNSIDEFEEKYGIPQIVGAIDGCHIEINAPPRNREDYYNRKQHYSVVLQGIVDSNLKFLHASVGYPGSIHDSRVLRLSGIYDQAESEQILSAPIRDLGGTNIRPLIVGDSAYPLSSWLIKPYQDRGHLPRDERKFNVKLSALRSVVERAFGMLKGRWRIVMKKIEQKVPNVTKATIAACVLHNICISLNDEYDGDESDSDGDDSSDDGGDFEPASDMRNAMKDYVWNNL